MSLAQFSALSGGRRFKRPYVEEINARTPYLPAINAQKKTDEYNQKMYDVSLQNLALRQDALDEQKKQQKKANRLGYANLALGAGLSLAGIADDRGWFDSAPDVAESISPSAANLFDLSSFDDPGGLTSLPFSAGGNILNDPGGLTPLAGEATDYLKKVGTDLGSGLYENTIGSYFDFGDAGLDALDYVGVGQF